MHIGISHVKFSIPLMNRTFRDRLLKFGVWNIPRGSLESSKAFLKCYVFLELNSFAKTDITLFYGPICTKLKIKVKFNYKILLKYVGLLKSKMAAIIVGYY